jgi:hypothetical protein
MKQLLIILTLTFITHLAVGQFEMPYDGIDSTKSICWRISPSFSRTDSQRRSLKEYELVQSDYLVIANCYDSSIVYSYPWKVPQKCINYYSENRDKVERDTLNKYFKIFWQDYYNNLSNVAIRDTVYIDPNNSSIMIDPRTEEDHFFLKKEKHFSPNSSDSTVLEFYTLDEVKNQCINDHYFRRKFLKMYRNGKPNGTWIEYDKQGKMIRRTEYQDGIIIKDETF